MIYPVHINKCLSWAIVVLPEEAHGKRGDSADLKDMYGPNQQGLPFTEAREPLALLSVHPASS